MIIIIILFQQFCQLPVVSCYKSKTVSVFQILKNRPGSPYPLSGIRSSEDLINGAQRHFFFIQAVQDSAQIPDFPDEITFSRHKIVLHSHGRNYPGLRHNKPARLTGINTLSQNGIHRHRFDKCRFSGSIGACDQTASLQIQRISHRTPDQRMADFLHIDMLPIPELRHTVYRKTCPEGRDADGRVQLSDLPVDFHIPAGFPAHSVNHFVV